MKKDAPVGSRKSVVTTTRDNIQGKLLGANVKEISIEKFRDAKSIPSVYKLNGKLSEQILKTISNKFSTDLIFNLDLSNQQLISIDSLAECKNLIMLNLSNNQIKDIFALQHCTSITFLNISFNAVTSCEVLKVRKDAAELESAISCRLTESNKLRAVKSLKGLEQCSNLTSLYLQTLSNKDNNQLCEEEKYRENVFDFLPQLERLDSIPKDMKFFTGEELEKSGKQLTSIDLNTPGYFYAPAIPKTSLFEKEINFDGEDQLKQSLKECKSSINSLESRIKALMA